MQGLTSLLEVSTFGENQLGRDLSAFNLLISIENRSHSVSVEAAYQSSKVFEMSGQQEFVLDWKNGAQIKAHLKQFAGEEVVGFCFEDYDWPLYPSSTFYNYLYLRALHQLSKKDDDLIESLRRYSGFTDIAFNPKKSINCQARVCALYVALGPSRVADILRTRETYLEFVSSKEATPVNMGPTQYFFNL